MCGATGKIKLLLATYAFLTCVVFQSCRAKVEHNTVQDCASSCGNIHNITYPFRLHTDPKHCGDKKYQLSCENNVTVLYYKRYGEPAYGLRVQAINYNNFTIRLSDPNYHLDNCSLPVADSSKYSSYYSDPYVDYSMSYFTSRGRFESTFRSLFFISCEYPMSGSDRFYDKKLFVYTSCNLRRHWYLKFGEFNASDIENSCRVETMVVTSLPMPRTTPNISYASVNSIFAYGFELSWWLACCSTSGVSTKYNCSYFENGFCKEFFLNDNNIRLRILSVLDYLWSYLNYVKVTSLFLEIFDALDRAFHIRQYLTNAREGITIWGLIFEFLVDILLILVLHRALLFFFGYICVTIFLIYKWRRRHQSVYDNVEEFLQAHHNYLMPVRYSYSQIKKFTKSFKEKLGEGGYGSVYKGKLRSGRSVAIKMLDKSKNDGQDFINEVATIGRIHHVNVVQLIGFCVEGSKRALVYEFMNNGSLDKHIFFKEGGLTMNNKMIFDISLGVAQGIKYLHRGCDMQILHFDIKPHNILLDEKFIPKISDFGLAKLHSTDHSIVSLTAARGTIGYIAPEFFYKNIGGISYKADVYSFGMLLLEMIGKRRNINAFTEHSSRIYFPSWIYDQFSEGKEINLGDKIEEGNDMVTKMIIVALWCIQLNPVNRPSMGKVIEMLEGEIEHLKMPPKPFVAPQETPTNDVGLITNPEISPTDASSHSSHTISLLID